MAHVQQQQDAGGRRLGQKHTDGFSFSGARGRWLWLGLRRRRWLNNYCGTCAIRKDASSLWARLVSQGILASLTSTESNKLTQPSDPSALSGSGKILLPPRPLTAHQTCVSLAISHQVRRGEIRPSYPNNMPELKV